MANGGWYGTQEEWRQAEAPLVGLDDRIERFARDYGFTLTRNHKDWPERSLTKEGRLSCTIQVWRAELEADAWNVWAVCSEDRGEKRFWKRRLLADRVSAERLGTSLGALLAEGLELLAEWSADPESLELATDLQPLPNHSTSGAAQGGVRSILRLKGLAVLAAAVALYAAGMTRTRKRSSATRRD